MSLAAGQIARLLGIVKQREEQAERDLALAEARLQARKRAQADYLAQLDHPMSFVLVSGRVIAGRMRDYEREVGRAERELAARREQLAQLKVKSSLLESRVATAADAARVAADEAALEELSETFVSHQFQAS